jgi:hypothetical protein
VKNEQQLKAGDRVTVWFASGFTRSAIIVSGENDGMVAVRYPDFPRLGADEVRADQIIG